MRLTGGPIPGNLIFITVVKREVIVEIVKSDKAPAPVGPYSQAVIAGNLVFTSGQIGIDPVSGELAAGLEEQTEQVFKNLSAVLAAAGSGLERVIKATVFITDMADFPRVNAIYARYFSTGAGTANASGDLPARSTVAVRALPKGALVEIEVIAERG